MGRFRWAGLGCVLEQGDGRFERPKSGNGYGSEFEGRRRGLVKKQSLITVVGGFAFWRKEKGIGQKQSLMVCGYGGF